MGYSRFDSTKWATYTSSISSKSKAEVFTSSNLHKDLDPKGVTFRESIDSTNNPISTPIIVGVDVTGSMGHLSEIIVRKGLGVLLEEIYARKPVTDPHVMLMAIGDATCDSAPLQVSQFESDNCLTEQLTKFYLEGGGGGNSCESYNMPWYFAAQKTKCDSFLKRKKKGYLFTVGDEKPPMTLRKQDIKNFIGDDVGEDISSRELLTMASKDWHVFHIIVTEYGYYKSNPTETKQMWTDLLGQHVLLLNSHKDLAELIVSTIQVNEGADKKGVIDSWSSETGLVIAESLKDLTPAGSSKHTGSVVRL